MEQSQQKEKSNTPIIADTQEKKLSDKYEQLNLDFNDFQASAPIPKDPIYNLKKVYLPFDFLKYPFFFQSRSDLVLESRKGYEKYKANNYTPPDEDITFNLSKLSKSYQEITLSKDKQGNNKGTYTKFSKEWHVEADIFWGLPDTFDGHIWDIIVQNISDIYRKTGQFYQYYYFSFQFIFRELNRQGAINQKKLGGSLSRRIKDSLYRIKNTQYRQVKKGFYRNDKKKWEHSYSINLITAIYLKGEKINDQTISHTAIAIDPLTLINLINKNYFITENTFRQHLIKYKSKTLHDKLSHLAYKGLKNGRFIYMKRISIKPFTILTYENLCNFLGINHLKGKTYQKGKIDHQFLKWHKELLDNHIIDNYFISKHNRRYRLIYIFSEEFLQNVFEIFSPNQKQQHENITQEDKESLFQFIYNCKLPDKAKKEIGLYTEQKQKKD